MSASRNARSSTTLFLQILRALRLALSERGFGLERKASAHGGLSTNKPVIERQSKCPVEHYVIATTISSTNNDNFIIMITCMYILECADGSYYVGSTTDLNRRLWQHQNSQGAKYTARRLPVRLVYQENYIYVMDAFRREKQVQGWSRKKKQALISGALHKLPLLAKCMNDTIATRPRADDHTK